MALTMETGSPDPFTSTSSAEDSLASPSRWLVEDLPSSTVDGFGLSWHDAFAYYDRATSSWRTSQGSLFEEWATFSATWPLSGTTASGRAYQRPPLVPRTFDGESSSWPTPTTPNGGRSIPKGATYGRNGLTAYKDGKKYQVDLAHVVKMWPTPTVQDASNDGGPSQFERNSLPLNAAVKMWTTPTADDTGHRKERYSQGGTALSLQAGGALNPTWVELLMGFPPGWTDLADS